MRFITKKVLLFSIMVFLIGCGELNLEKKGYSIKIPISVIQSRINSNFPLVKKLNYGTLTISNAKLLEQEGEDKLSVLPTFNFTNFLLPKGLVGTIYMDSSIRYDEKTKNLFLKDLKVNEIKLNDISTSRFLTNDMKKTISNIASDAIENYPIYNLESKSIAANFIKDIYIKNGDVYVTIGF